MATIIDSDCRSLDRGFAPKVLSDEIGSVPNEA